MRGRSRCAQLAALRVDSGCAAAPRRARACDARLRRSSTRSPARSNASARQSLSLEPDRAGLWWLCAWRQGCRALAMRSRRGSARARSAGALRRRARRHTPTYHALLLENVLDRQPAARRCYCRRVLPPRWRTRRRACSARWRCGRCPTASSRFSATRCRSRIRPLHARPRRLGVARDHVQPGVLDAAGFARLEGAVRAAGVARRIRLHQPGHAHGDARLRTRGRRVAGDHRQRRLREFPTRCAVSRATRSHATLEVDGHDQAGSGARIASAAGA